MLTTKMMGPEKRSRDKLLEDNLYLVKIIAYQVAVNLPPHIDVNDLIGAGTIGLIEAIDRFDTGKGVQFNTYASIRVRGAIMDELRSMDWMTRSMRDKSNQLEKAYIEVERRTGRPAEIEEVASVLDITTDDLYTILSQVSALSVMSLEDLGIGHHDEGMDILECIKDPEGKDPMTIVKFNEIKRKIAEAVETLPEKEKLIISLYYYEELTLREIGKVLNITESRVCQLHSQTMHRLKGKLKRCVGV
ncbi:MAG: FliA/WhiG family RNA polymerase sigma factor [Deltaproteobacteria bacterium]|nr:FliA/WhiG family RNA polymerase sigma factor [Deltaproteobacteria bacterium]